MKTKLLISVLLILFNFLQSKASVYIDSVMTENNISYTLNYCLPNNYDETEEYPLIVAMHYCGGTSKQYRDGLSALSDSLNMIVVCPDNNSLVIPETELNMLITAIDSSKQFFNIDTTQIFLTGMSCNGEFITRHGLNNFYPFKGIFPWVPWILTQDPNLYNFNSYMPIVIGIGSNDPNYKSVMAIYDSLNTNGANVNLLLVPNKGHSMSFENFSDEMINCIYYLNGIPDFKINNIEDFNLLNSDSITFNITIDNPENKELSYSASYNNSLLISNMEVLPGENENEFNLKLVPVSTRKGEIIITLKAYDKENSLMTQELIYIDLQADKTDINQINQTEFKIYPNPVNNYIYFSDENEVLSIRIIDLNGKEVKRSENINTSNGIQVQSLPKGNYLLEVKGIDFNKILKFTKL